MQTTSLAPVGTSLAQTGGFPPLVLDNVSNADLRALCQEMYSDRGFLEGVIPERFGPIISTGARASRPASPASDILTPGRPLPRNRRDLGALPAVECPEKFDPSDAVRASTASYDSRRKRGIGRHRRAGVRATARGARRVAAVPWAARRVVPARRLDRARHRHRDADPGGLRADDRHHREAVRCEPRLGLQCTPAP